MISRLLRNRLGVRLVVISLLIGSVLSVFSTGVQLLASYQSQKDDATEVLDQIDQALTETLEFALWTLDFEQIDVILDGIAANEAVSYLDLTSVTGDRWQRGTPVEEPVSQIYDLVHDRPGSAQQLLGTLRVHLSLDAVVSRVWEQFWITLITNLAKAYIAALALLYVAHVLITRHLRNIATYVADTDVHDGTADLKLERPSRQYQDDLDSIVLAIRNFENRAREAFGLLQREVQDRIKSESEAREALSVRSSFIGTMSHEVRTPLNAILGFLHLIETNEDVPEKQRHYAHVATKAAQQLHHQLTNVLEVSRLDSNAVTIIRRATDLRRLAEQWRDTTEATVHFHQKAIKVTLDLDPDLDEAYNLDGPRLTQIVTNLTDNAAKFTASGEIRISVRCVPQSRDGEDTHGLEICVADTGEGIEKYQVQNVFERFTQSDAGLKRAHGGSGLGLTISREMSELMGAELTLDAKERDGFSTRFLITLGCNVRLGAHDD
ncbi:ATP-binding protein [Tateyamaria armeniaca]|uniref:histidine kinase n=1 Tax=Tateyamaria armeniaca TaxID=2518930 RepID=A0ABW8UWV1_9RHOB